MTASPAQLEPHDRPSRTHSRSVALYDTVPVFQQGMVALLEQTPALHWAGHATTLQSTITLCQKERPDILVLAANLDAHGTLSRALLSRGLVSTVIVVIDEGADAAQRAASALSGGAHGVVLRCSDGSVFADALLTAYLERRFVDPYMARTKKHGRPRADMPLSAREREVLQLLASGLASAAIAVRLEISVETVRTHTQRLLRKLGARNRCHAIATALRTGVLSTVGVAD